MVLQEIGWAKRFDSSAFINSLVGLGLLSFYKRMEAVAPPRDEKELPYFPRPLLGGEVKVRGEVPWKEG